MSRKRSITAGLAHAVELLSLISAFLSFGGIHGVLIGFIAALVAFGSSLWQALDKQSRPWRVFWVVMTAVAVFFVAYFGLSLLVLWLVRSPSDYGVPIDRGTTHFELTEPVISGSIAGDHAVRLTRAAAAVTIELTPDDADRNRATRLTVTPVPARKDQVSMLNLSESTQAGVLLTNPDSSLQLTLRTVADLRDRSDTRPLTIFVAYSYYERGFLWRLEKCVYETYGSPLRWRYCWSD